MGMNSNVAVTNLEKIKQINSRLDSKNIDEVEKSVKSILDSVKDSGNEALKELTSKFDSYELSDDDLKGISPKGYFEKLEPKLNEALLLAEKRITRFHEEEFANSKFNEGWKFTGDLGEELGVKYTALDSVAIYVPGGQAPLISTVLMTAIPAITAGVKRIVMFSPPPINHAVLAVAELVGVKEVYSVGGAQAVAAAAYGTETIKPVDKIVGPGNIFVSTAKKQVFGTIGIDGIYGPSELAIIADETAKPKHLAADFLSQLEHGSGLESALLLCTDEKVLAETETEIERQIEALKEFKSEKVIETIKNSYKTWSACLLANEDEIPELINYYAPEHLEIQLTKERLTKIIEKIKHAGAIFIGANSCESLGDYLAGPSHCLPTGRTARFSSGLHCADFIKKSSIIDFSNINNASKDFIEISKSCSEIARAESLEGHAKAMDFRIEEQKRSPL
ncbi:MAG: histidinol dehydrogenase [Candidatus Caenarcaniphilales bacterium]|nr:histidinol dehydrogenase [Candidatus Caenarcaniphilales bacterium]